MAGRRQTRAKGAIGGAGPHGDGRGAAVTQESWWDS
jgi:hypothetical protein